MSLPLAHVGHYLWVFYLVPVVIVIAGILRSVILDRRHKDQD
ncbi:MAG TPA: hypothetical protein VG458_00610 [Solirubrobacterales bacterium]|nr:hypothetical protein [Solirubrobacterales bacterium]